MRREYNIKHIFLVIATCVVLFSPIYILLMPNLVAETIYYDRNSFLTYVPSANYWVFGISIYLFALCFVLLGLLKSWKFSIPTALIVLALSGCTFYFASLSYVSLNQDQISYRTMFSIEKEIYKWEELSKVSYYMVEQNSDKLPYYNFYFNNGEMFTIKENTFVLDASSNIRGRIKTAEVPIEHVETWHE